MEAFASRMVLCRTRFLQGGTRRVEGIITVGMGVYSPAFGSWTVGFV